MKPKQESISALRARRLFLRKIGRAATYAGAVASAGAVGILHTDKTAAKAEPASAGKSFPTPDYDWTKHRWAFGVDATKCIGCLRCVVQDRKRYGDA